MRLRGWRTLVAGVLAASGGIGSAVAVASISFQTTDYPLSRTGAVVVQAGQFRSGTTPTLDVVAADPSNNRGALLRNDGAGNFSTSPFNLYPNPGKLGYMAAGDFNQDGVDDLVGVAQGPNATNGVQLLLSNGSGGFAEASGSPYPLAHGATDIVVARLSGPGAPPSAVVAESDGFSVYPDQQAAGQYQLGTPTHTSALSGGSSGAIAAADLNGDGAGDIVEAFPASNAIKVLLQQNGSFAVHSTITLPSTVTPSALALADVTGRGKLDLIVLDSQGGTLRVLPGRGDGTFDDTHPIVSSWGVGPGDSHATLVIADVDRDGHRDAILLAPDPMSGTGDVVVLTGDGGGHFSSPTAVAHGQSLAVGDFDRNGSPDLAVGVPSDASPGSQAKVSILLNTSTPPPGVVSGSTTGVTQTSATLNGTIDSHGQGSTNYHFEYGTTPSYGTSTPTTPAPGGSGAQTVSATLSGLAPGTTYYYRLDATGPGGSVVGQGRTFTTSSLASDHATFSSQHERLLPGDRLPLDGSRSTGSGHLSYTWSVANGGRPTVLPGHRSAEVLGLVKPGQLAVALTVRDSTGATSTNTQNFLVGQRPKVVLRVGPAHPRRGERVRISVVAKNVWGGSRDSGSGPTPAHSAFTAPLFGVALKGGTNPLAPDQTRVSVLGAGWAGSLLGRFADSFSADSRFTTLLGGSGSNPGVTVDQPISIDVLSKVSDTLFGKHIRAGMAYDDPTPPSPASVAFTDSTQDVRGAQVPPLCNAHPDIVEQLPDLNVAANVEGLITQPAYDLSNAGQAASFNRLENPALASAAGRARDSGARAASSSTGGPSATASCARSVFTNVGTANVHHSASWNFGDTHLVDSDPRNPNPNVIIVPLHDPAGQPALVHHSYSQPGDYTVTLKVTDARTGETNTTQNIVHIRNYVCGPLSVVGVTAIVPANRCFVSTDANGVSGGYTPQRGEVILGAPDHQAHFTLDGVQAVYPEKGIFVGTSITVSADVQLPGYPAPIHEFPPTIGYGLSSVTLSPSSDIVAGQPAEMLDNKIRGLSVGDSNYRMVGAVLHVPKDSQNAEPSLDVQIQLPQPLQGYGIVSTNSLQAARDRRSAQTSAATHFSLDVGDVPFGPLQMRDVTFSADDSGLHGSFNADVLKQASALTGSFNYLNNGGWDGTAHASVGDIPIVPGLLDVTALQANLGTKPVRFSGGVDISVAGGIIRLPAACLGFVYVGQSDLGRPPVPLCFSGYQYPPDHLGPAIRAEVPHVLVKYLGDVGGGYAQYDPDGVSFGAHFDTHPFRVLHFTADLDGALHDAGNWFVHGDFQIDQKILCLPLAGCLRVTGQAIVSNNGIGACGTIHPLPDLGFYYRWDGGGGIIKGDCDAGLANVQAGARDAAAGSAVHLTLHKAPFAILELDGQTGAPLVDLRGPTGQRIHDTGAPIQRHGAHSFVAHSEALKATIISIPDPAGNWTIAVHAGSSSAQRILVSYGLAPLAPKVRVLGRGQVRTLVYYLNPAAGRSVTFAERVGRGEQTLGTARGRTGKIVFTPSPGPGGRRNVDALISVGGIPRKVLTVASYIAPGPTRPRTPRRFKLVRRQMTLTATWLRDPAAHSYALECRFAGGGLVGRTLPGRASSIRLTLPDIGAAAHCKLTPISVIGLPGRPAFGRSVVASRRGPILLPGVRSHLRERHHKGHRPHR